MALDITQHRDFLEEIEAEREELQTRLDRLEAVAEYHRQKAEELERAGMNGHAVEVPQESEEPACFPPADDLARATKHEACRMALQSLGGRAKTSEIADWLTARGYGSQLESRVLHNACFTALNRKTEMFRKAGPGEWELLE